MPDLNENPPATVPAQREAVGPVKKSTPIVNALIAIVALIGIANVQRQDETRTAECATCTSDDGKSAAGLQF